MGKKEQSRLYMARKKRSPARVSHSIQRCVCEHVYLYKNSHGATKHTPSHRIIFFSPALSIMCHLIESVAVHCQRGILLYVCMYIRRYGAHHQERERERGFSATTIDRRRGSQAQRASFIHVYGKWATNLLGVFSITSTLLSGDNGPTQLGVLLCVCY